MSDHHSSWDGFPSCHELADAGSEAWQKAYGIFWRAGMGLCSRDYGKSIDAENIVQESILGMMKYFHSNGRGSENARSLETTAAIRALFFQILRNQIISALRKVRHGVSLDDKEAHIDPGLLGETRSESDPELANALEECISKLPENEAALVRSRLLGMSLKEAAEMVRINYNLTMTLVAQARKSLHLCLKRKGFDSFA